jgi:tetratricopeptide (TPR) repeat protein
MTVQRWRAIPAVCLTFWAAGSSVRAEAATISRERQAELLKSALDAFDRAVTVTREDPLQAESLYRDAARGFEALAEAGVRSAPLEYNLGNAYFRLNNLGKSILHYRRAERLDPMQPDMAANLDYARRRVEPLFFDPAGAALIDRLSFWNRNLSVEWRFRIAAIGSAVGWLLLLAWLRWRVRPLALAGGLAALIGLANSVSVAWQIRDESARPPAVLVESNLVLRHGRGAAYEAVLKQPLGAGVEVRILEARGDWVEVRLPDGVSGWVPASAVVRV